MPRAAVKLPFGSASAQVNTFIAGRAQLERELEHFPLPLSRAFAFAPCSGSGAALRLLYEPREGGERSEGAPAAGSGNLSHTVEIITP